MRRQRKFEVSLSRERERQQKLAEKVQRKQRRDAYQDAWKKKINFLEGSLEHDTRACPQWKERRCPQGGSREVLLRLPIWG